MAAGNLTETPRRDHGLQPGWRLALPAGPPAESPERVVVAGDTLSAIAAEELGEAGRYPDLVRATSRSCSRAAFI